MASAPLRQPSWDRSSAAGLLTSFGRKATLLWIGVLYFVGAVGSGLATNVSLFIAARINRRSGHRHLYRSSSAVHLGNCAAEVPWTTCRHVPVQHCFWHPDRFRIQTRCSLASARMPGAGCLVSPRSPHFSTRCSASGLPESPRWLLGRKGDRAGGLEVLQTHRTRCPESRDRSRRRTRLPLRTREKRHHRISGHVVCANRSCLLS